MVSRRSLSSSKCTSQFGFGLAEKAWRPRVPGVGGRSRGKSKARARRRGYGVLARDEDAKGQWRHTQVTRPMWFPSSRTCSACGRVNAKLKRERTWNCPNCGPGMTGT